MHADPKPGVTCTADRASPGAPAGHVKRGKKVSYFELFFRRLLKHSHRANCTSEIVKGTAEGFSVTSLPFLIIVFAVLLASSSAVLLLIRAVGFLGHASAPGAATMFLSACLSDCCQSSCGYQNVWVFLHNFALLPLPVLLSTDDSLLQTNLSISAASAAKPGF